MIVAFYMDLNKKARLDEHQGTILDVFSGLVYLYLMETTITLTMHCVTSNAKMGHSAGFQDNDQFHIPVNVGCTPGLLRYVKDILSPRNSRI